MKKSTLAILGIAVAVVAIVLNASLFTVHQTEQALVLQFGSPKRVETEPGLKFKVPFIQNVVRYDSRVLDLDPPGQQVPLRDQKRIIVDTYARYEIVDPLKFYQTVRGELGLRDRFGSILNSAVRDQLGEADLTDLLAESRGRVMEEITDAVRRRADEFGIKVVDVRIGRTDLPQETSQSVFNRMRSSRIAQAAQLRAEGEELKAKIQAEADRDRTVILAEARKTGEILRGQGDGDRNRILGESYGANPEFFAFYRSMDAYRQALGNGGTTMVLSPDSDFFRYFDQAPSNGQIPQLSSAGQQDGGAGASAQ
ncbi:HflC protein [Caenispirillum salinarum AK4]|uniref:Protein HflC n=1 Tax=Caenispirillum salinarum AK4 TaxID=1238182 RepID=K9GQ93_9PROT|nr:protease modulator HflC [Caenispirillum salinarum]EKV27332.1 HflC protein [Caenispirillum salinarum AK4]